MSKVVLITGASAGLGREAAILLGRQGHTVYAGARRVDRMADMAGRADLAGRAGSAGDVAGNADMADTADGAAGGGVAGGGVAGGGVIPVEMDVTRAEDNERVVSRIIEDEGRIDVLVNNAGFGLYGPVEDIPIDDARYQFEVNLFGLAHLTQLVLPHMRAQGSGRIVNVSSMVGKVFTPMGAWYIATKHALEGWSDCLRLETARFGIQVVLIQPGAIQTEFADIMGALLDEFPDDSPYHAEIDTLSRLMGDPRAAEHRTSAATVAKVYAKAATTRRPRRRYVTGALARPWMYTRKWLGDAAFEFMLRRTLR